MRFARQREQSSGRADARAGRANPLIKMVYNLVWWIPILLTFVGVIDYRAGFTSFAAVTLVRLGANLYLNNVLEPEQAESFPFRI